MTELHDEKVSVSVYMAHASSYPVTMYTPCCGSRRTGHWAAEPVEVGVGSSTSSSPRKKSMAS